MHNTYAYINESIDNIFKIKCRQNFSPKKLVDSKKIIWDFFVVELTEK